MRLDRLIIYTLATARLTGLATSDVITAGLRDRVRARLVGTRAQHHVDYLLGDGTHDGCPWCASIWIAAAVAPAAFRWGDRQAMLIPATVLAMSQAVSMAARVGR